MAQDLHSLTESGALEVYSFWNKENAASEVLKGGSQPPHN